MIAFPKRRPNLTEHGSPKGMEVIDQIKRGEPVRDPDTIKTMRVEA